MTLQAVCKTDISKYLNIISQRKFVPAHCHILSLYIGIMTEYYPRDIADTVGSALKNMPIVVVTGMRQTGKTTFLRSQPDLKDRIYVSFDDFSQLEAAKGDPDGFVNRGKPITIDYAQKCHEIFAAVKRCGQRENSRWQDAVLYFWSIQGRNEVDFVIEAERSCIALELKSASRWQGRDLAGLNNFLKATPHCTAAILCHNGEDAVKLGEKLWALPANLILS
jgi:predicted AAA+ superfamily ATPase